eukprot:354576_1
MLNQSLRELKSNVFIFHHSYVHCSSFRLDNAHHVLAFQQDHIGVFHEFHHMHSKSLNPSIQIIFCIVLCRYITITIRTIWHLHCERTKFKSNRYNIFNIIFVFILCLL